MSSAFWLLSGEGKVDAGNVDEVGDVTAAPVGSGGRGIAGGGDGKVVTEALFRRLEAANELRSICWESRICACSCVSISSGVSKP